MADTTDRDISAVEIAKLEGRMDAEFAEVGGKLDTLIAKQDAAEAKRADDRATADARYQDHESRLRAHDKEIAETRAVANNAITPRKFWGAFGTVAALVIAAAGVVINATT